VRVARAIVRLPSSGLADGITSASLGTPIYAGACAQHAAYCEALREAGADVTVLDADLRHPDAHFVEDAAVLIGTTAVLTRPGAAARRDEPQAIRAALAEHFCDIEEIVAPGTLDGGDVCDAGDRIFVGISRRTSRDGADQFARIARRAGKAPVVVDVCGIAGALHLKSAMAYLGDGRFVATLALAPLLHEPRERVLLVAPGEEYAANCVRVNDTVLIAAGSPHLHAALAGAGYASVPLEVSEFRKMDGGLSCLSLRF
jgi:dimethylargininase